MNFPYLLYLYALQGEVPRPVNGSGEEIYWIDPGKDLVESVRSYRQEMYSLSEYLDPYLKPHTFTVIARGDMSPFMQRCSDIAKEGIHRIIKKCSSKDSR